MDKQKKISDGQKMLMAFLGGAAAGVAAGLYLNSDSGREVRSKAASQISDLEGQLEDRISEAISEFKDGLPDLSRNGSKKVKAK